MAWNRHKPKKASSKSADTAVSKQDQKTAYLEAAFAKIKYPPPVESLVGTVVQAGSKTMPNSTTPSSSATTAVQASSQQAVQKTPPSAKPVNVSADPTASPSQAVQTVSPAQPRPIAQPVQLESPKPALSQPQIAEPTGPLSPKELHALGTFLKQKQQEKQPPANSSMKVDTIAPTNPEPDAAIATQIAEKQRLAEEAAATEDAKKWHVTRAEITETKLDMRKMYIRGALWLGSPITAYILYEIVQAVGGGKIHGLAGFIILLPIYILGFYGLVGWIPLVLEYLKTVKK